MRLEIHVQAELVTTAVLVVAIAELLATGACNDRGLAIEHVVDIEPELPARAIIHFPAVGQASVEDCLGRDSVVIYIDSFNIGGGCTSVPFEQSATVVQGAIVICRLQHDAEVGNVVVKRRQRGVFRSGDTLYEVGIDTGCRRRGAFREITYHVTRAAALFLFSKEVWLGAVLELQVDTTRLRTAGVGLHVQDLLHLIGIGIASDQTAREWILCEIAVRLEASLLQA